MDIINGKNFMKLVFTMTLFLMLCTQNVSGQVAVITHKSTLSENIGKNEILDFYTGDIKTWENGERVIVYDLKQNTSMKDAFYQFLGKSSSRMKAIWMKKKLSGEGDPPVSFQSEEEIVEKITSTPGSLGYISYEKVTDDVAVLFVINYN